jgi:hypothetical protein
MKLEVFTAIIEALEKQGSREIEAAKIGIDLLDYEEDWVLAVTLLLNAYYGKIGGDWIGWYLYERNLDESPALAVDADNQAICFDVPSLWNHVEKLRVSDEFVEFELPEKTTITEADVYKFFSGNR